MSEDKTQQLSIETMSLTRKEELRTFVRALGPDELGLVMTLGHESLARWAAIGRTFRTEPEKPSRKRRKDYGSTKRPKEE